MRSSTLVFALFVSTTLAKPFRDAQPHRALLRTEHIQIRQEHTTFKSRATDIQVVHDRVLQSFLPTNDTIAALVGSTKGYQKNLNSTCFFADINYSKDTANGWQAAVHVSRLRAMAQVYTWAQSPLFNDTTLGTQIHCALGAWFKADPRSKTNWFNDVILVPLDIGRFIMLMGTSRLSTAEISSLNKITFRSSWWVNDWGGGANLLNMLQIQMWRGLATANTTAVEQGFDRAWADVIIQPTLNGQGIMPDDSYHFHSSQLMSGSYGAAWLGAVLDFAVQTIGTGFEMNDAQKETLANAIVAGYAWIDIGNKWDFGAIGRYVARPVSSQHSPLDSMDSLRQFALLWPRKTAVINAYIDRRLALPGAETLEGNRYFYTSDFMVHRHKTWISTLRLQSQRNVATECANGENLKGEHLSNGVLNVYAKDAQIGNGDEYNYIFPLWDWKTINGVTAESNTPLLTCWNPPSGNVQFPLKKLSFVGGVSDGIYGAATMDTATHSLTAHRSWFFFDNFILHMGANLTDPSAADVRTALNTRILSDDKTDPDAHLTIGWRNGSNIAAPDGGTIMQAGSATWIHAGGVGYLIGGDLKMGAVVGQTSGTWDTIGAYTGTVSKRTISSWIEHGAGPNGVSFTYSVIPNVTATNMPERVSEVHQGLKCIFNLANVQAVSLPSIKRSFVVVYPPASASSPATYNCPVANGGGWGIQITAPAGLYIVSEDDTTFTVTASTPVPAAKTVDVTVSRAGTGTGCKQVGGNTVVTLYWPQGFYLGKSVSVTCQK